VVLHNPLDEKYVVEDDGAPQARCNVNPDDFVSSTPLHISITDLHGMMGV